MPWQPSHIAIFLWASLGSPAGAACCANAGAANVRLAASSRRRMGIVIVGIRKDRAIIMRFWQRDNAMRFAGSADYVSTEDLTLAVNAAITLQRPLLVKGEPGTGKTMLAVQVAKSLGVPLLEWHIKSTTKAQQGLYEYDAVSRLRDSQLGDARVHDIHNYIVKGMLWQAFSMDTPCVLLIDEVDKADIEFPNDLLRELDRMEFYVYETRELVKARQRPIVFITSNNEKELPDAFLRRCFFHYIRFPDKETMEKIVHVHYPTLKKSLLKEAMEVFFEVREVPGLKKKPSTSELLDWLKLLLAEDIPPDALRSKDRSASGGMSSASRSLSQSSSSEVEGFFFRPGTSRTSKNTSIASLSSDFLRVG